MATPTNATTGKDDIRYYEWNGRKLMSATSLRRTLGMAFSLHTWVVKQVIEGAVATDRGPLGDDEYRRLLWKASRSKRDAAASLGTSVHEAAELGVQPSQMSDDDERKPFLEQYEAAIEATGFKVVLNEAQVFNLTHGYAGSLDIIAEATRDLPEYGITKGELVLIDLKTGKGVYNDHALQLALYFGAEFVGGYDPFEDKDVVFDGPTAILNACTQAGVLHIRPDEWEFIPIPQTDELAAAAVDLTRIAGWFKKYPDIKKLIGATK